MYFIILYLPGFASSHWVLSVSAEYGVIEYSGLWEKCADLSIGYHDYECEGFVWEDFQVSREFFIFVANEGLHVHSPLMPFALISVCPKICSPEVCSPDFKI